VLERCYFGATTSLSKGINFVCDPGDTVIFRGNVVEQNIATAPFGTGNIVVAGAAGEIAYNIVRDNTTREAQIYAFQGTTIAIHHNVFARNVSDWHPSVLRTGPNPHQTFFENIITGNSGNTVAYVPSEPNFIDARNNYWGHPSGPYHPTLNSAGQGDTLLSDSVFFIPWLTEPPDTTFVSAGDRERRPDIAATWQLLDLYPNPFNSEIRIAIGGFTRDDFSLRLFDLLGRERATLHRGPLTGGRLSFTAPPALANGVYFVVASDRNFTETRKAILLK
jgi:hypothetical protein